MQMVVSFMPAIEVNGNMKDAEQALCGGGEFFSLIEALYRVHDQVVAVPVEGRAQGTQEAAGAQASIEREAGKEDYRQALGRPLTSVMDGVSVRRGFFPAPMSIPQPRAGATVEVRAQVSSTDEAHTGKPEEGVYSAGFDRDLVRSSRVSGFIDGGRGAQKDMSEGQLDLEKRTSQAASADGAGGVFIEIPEKGMGVEDTGKRLDIAAMTEDIKGQTDEAPVVKEEIGTGRIPGTEASIAKESVKAEKLTIAEAPAARDGSGIGRSYVTDEPTGREAAKAARFSGSDAPVIEEGVVTGRFPGSGLSVIEEALTVEQPAKAPVVNDGIRPVKLHREETPATEVVSAEAPEARRESGTDPGDFNDQAIAVQDTSGQEPGGGFSGSEAGGDLSQRHAIQPDRPAAIVSGTAFQAALDEPAGPAPAAVKDIYSELGDKLYSGIRVSVQNGGGEVRMRLSPDSLGELVIKLNIRNETVRAEIMTESHEIKRLIEADSSILKEALGSHGLSLKECVVSVARAEHDGPGRQGFSDRHGRDERPRSESRWDGHKDSGRPKYGRHAAVTGGIDIFV